MASFTITLSPTENDNGSEFTASVDKQSVTADEGTSPSTTWYSRILVKSSLPSGVSNAFKSISASVNAWSVGAKTVNGPFPCNVERRSACTIAATKALWIPVL